MSNKDSISRQKIKAGSGSSNVQVQGDYHHHEAPKRSSLIVPSQSEIDRFDSRYGKIRDAADREITLGDDWVASDEQAGAGAELLLAYKAVAILALVLALAILWVLFG